MPARIDGISNKNQGSVIWTKREYICRTPDKIDCTSNAEGLVSSTTKRSGSGDGVVGDRCHMQRTGLEATTMRLT
jgi:hypothetical protein